MGTIEVGQIHPRVAAVAEEGAGILANFNAEVVGAWEGEAKIRATVADTMINASGFAHGSLTYALMDTACAYALGSIERRGVTISGNIAYVAAASAGMRVLGISRVVNAGRRTASLRGECYALDAAGAQDKLLAHGTFVFQMLQ